MLGQLWICPQCGVGQWSYEVHTVEIVEPGKNPRVEYHGKIRPNYRTRIYNHSPKTGPVEQSWVEYSCLVCGHVWNDPDSDDPTPGGSAITFLHPVLEVNECCGGRCGDRDAC